MSDLMFGIDWRNRQQFCFTTNVSRVWRSNLATNVVPSGYGLQCQRTAADLAAAHTIMAAERAAWITAEAKLTEAAIPTRSSRALKR